MSWICLAMLVTVSGGKRNHPTPNQTSPKNPAPQHSHKYTEKFETFSFGSVPTILPFFVISCKMEDIHARRFSLEFLPLASRSG